MLKKCRRWRRIHFAGGRRNYMAQNQLKNFNTGIERSRNDSVSLSLKQVAGASTEICEVPRIEVVEKNKKVSQNLCQKRMNSSESFVHFLHIVGQNMTCF